MHRYDICIYTSMKITVVNVNVKDSVTPCGSKSNFHYLISSTFTILIALFLWHYLVLITIYIVINKIMKKIKRSVL